MKISNLIIISFFILAASTSFSVNAKSAKEINVTKEEREKMALMHKTMAICLESDKSIDECQKEMRKNCSEMHTQMGCKMMGGGMMNGKGMMQGN
jgi:hypothetical protein